MAQYSTGGDIYNAALVLYIELDSKFIWHALLVTLGYRKLANRQIAVSPLKEASSLNLARRKLVTCKYHYGG